MKITVTVRAEQDGVVMQEEQVVGHSSFVMVLNDDGVHVLESGVLRGTVSRLPDVQALRARAAAQNN